MDPVEPGLACGSDTAHMSILGYEPRTLYRGRGAFESLGIGMDMKPGDIAFKCNFAVLNEDSGIVEKRRVDRRFEVEGQALCRDLDGMAIPEFPEHHIRVKYATEHRCGVIIRGEGLTDTVTSTDPLRDRLPLMKSVPLEDTDAARFTSSVVNAASKAIQDFLKHHPVNERRRASGKPSANVLLLRGCCGFPSMPSFFERHGLRSCAIAPVKIIRGLAICLGMEVLSVPGTTGGFDSLFHLKSHAMAERMRGPLQAVDFGFLHIKAVDEASHEGRVDWKVEYLQVADQVIGQLIRLLWENETETCGADVAGEGSVDTSGAATYSIVITGDHTTPVRFGDHSCEPVPLAIASVKDIVCQLGGGTAIESIPLGEISVPLSKKHADGDATQAVDVDSGGCKDMQALHHGCTKDSSDAWHARDIDNGPQERHGPPLDDLAVDAVQRFNEIDAAEGALGRFPGREVMPLIMNFAFGGGMQ